MPLLHCVGSPQTQEASGLASDLLRKLWLLEAPNTDEFWDKEELCAGPKELFEATSSWEQSA
jgi:hypothetical protein